MCQWHRNIQRMIDEIGRLYPARRRRGVNVETAWPGSWGYSESYVSRKFRELSGMRLRNTCAAAGWPLPSGICAAAETGFWTLR